MKIRQWNMTKHPACFITGDSGDGKTWLCTQMAEEAMQAGATVILADPVKGWDIGEPRLRRLKQAGVSHMACKRLSKTPIDTYDPKNLLDLTGYYPRTVTLPDGAAVNATLNIRGTQFSLTQTSNGKLLTKGS